MAEDHIRYDILTREALRGVVRKVLSEVAKTGLPGDHHFFISFMTRAPGVRLSPRLLAQYEKEMTIVLQNQFWSLRVTETGFEVGLSFDGVQETLGIPFAAIKGFFDPSIQFGLQFDDVDRPYEPAELAAADTVPTAPVPSAAHAEALPAEADSGEKVVSLDAFRKKP